VEIEWQADFSEYVLLSKVSSKVMEYSQLSGKIMVRHTHTHAHTHTHTHTHTHIYTDTRMRAHTHTNTHTYTHTCEND